MLISPTNLIPPKIAHAHCHTSPPVDVYTQPHARRWCSQEELREEPSMSVTTVWRAAHVRINVSAVLPVVAANRNCPRRRRPDVNRTTPAHRSL
jgi:hypothetical protein